MLNQNLFLWYEKDVEKTAPSVVRFEKAHLLSNLRPPLKNELKEGRQ